MRGPDRRRTAPPRRTPDEAAALFAENRRLAGFAVGRLLRRRPEALRHRPGLVAAAEDGVYLGCLKWSPDGGALLSTYCMHWAWGRMLLHLALEGGGVVAAPRQRLREAPPVYSLNDYCRERDDGERELEPALPDPRARPPQEALEREERRAAVRAAVARLPERQALALTLRFGLGGGPPLTAREVGRALGTSTQRAAQIEHEARRRLAGLLPPPGDV